MNTTEDISIDIGLQEYISGSQEYSANVTVTNTSGKPLINLQVFNTLSAGREANRGNDISDSNLTDLEDRKQRLIKELEKNVELCLWDYRYKQFSFQKKILYHSVEFFEMYFSVLSAFSKGKTPITTPIYAEEALRIDEWEDVERLEKDIISLESDDSLRKKTYSIDKDKLQKVLSKLAEENDKKFFRGITLHPSSTTSFLYQFKAPHLLKQRKMDISFKASYKLEGEEIVHTRTVTKKILLYPSAFAVPTGGIIGAIIGYIIKATIASKAVFVFSWGNFIGIVALGLLFSSLSSRNSDVSKWITVEDFTGGFIIGAMAGIFSESILAKLQSLM